MAKLTRKQEKEAIALAESESITLEQARQLVEDLHYRFDGLIDVDGKPVEYGPTEPPDGS